MNVIQNVSKKELTEVRDNDIDKHGKKIKVRDANYINLVRHIRKIPSRGFQILPGNNVEFKSGNSRAITVKEKVLNSIAEKGFSNAFSQNQTTVNNSTHTQIIGWNEQKNDIIKNVDSYFRKISRERQGLLNDKEQLDKIIKNVNNSTKVLNELSIKESEEQKKLEEKQLGLDSVNQKIIAAIKSQMDTLNETRKRYQSLLEEKSIIEMENQQKIVQFQSRIDEIAQSNLNIESDIARQQDILNALMNFKDSDNIVEFPSMSDNSDVITGKVA